MDTSILAGVSNQLADIVTSVSNSVVQVQGRRRPASGVVYADGVVVTTASVLGRGDSFAVRQGDGASLQAELAGWDPATSLAVLKVPGLVAAPVRASEVPPRVGHIALALARSWSNAVTASAGIVAVIGGPLRTGRRRAIAQVIRTTAPMHDGFAGGAFVDSTGGLIGITTAAAIRGLGVVIPTSIAWPTAAAVLAHGGSKRGYLGLASQPVRLPDAQRGESEQELGLLVVNVTDDSPASRAGLMIGDVLWSFDGHGVQTPEDLLDLLGPDCIGRSVQVGIVRAANRMEVTVTVGERPAQ
jgi:S1-C subfamily serine protease